ncbi:tetratricopeptide repeat protein [Marinifilum caeruleilacunae]|uniref:type IX secretion system periplasmic lipoprotein PorW/SprE n=1 Tax=Marinifilum caeruleilacunae TaxID=2499076 RepID=UPI001491AAF4|nr:tetratricopeptide repeat protein [Marinifilum caeruleilacunae]
MTRKYIQFALTIISVLIFAYACSNQKNTFVSRQYHALTTHYNVYFNGKESLKEGEQRIENGLQENYTILLPVFEYQNPAARTTSFSSMDRALEKATKAIKIHSITRKPKRKKGNQSEKYKEFRKKKEYNNWIDDCYMLIGKAQFYKGEYHVAEKAFDFILREYPESDLVSEAKLWKAVSLIDRGEFISGGEILDRIDDRKELSKDDLVRIEALYADMAIRQEQYDDAVPALERCIAITKKKHKKARYYYLLAQIHQKLDNPGEASRAFQQLIDLNANYEMTFNAKISRALSYTGAENGEEIRKGLRKMLRDEKNKEYKDQIYYAIAEMDVVDENMESAIENYWESTKVSLFNENQKAISFLKLGDYYFGEETYPKAQMCYDSSMTYLGNDYPNYNQISERVGNLTELVNNLNMVVREDSLQRVALMSQADRDRLISQMIKEVADKERERRDQEAEAQSDRAFFSQNNMLGNTVSRNQSQGNWYFYNPTNIGLGKSEFQRKWGRRKLEDNWRRKNRSSFTPDDVEFILEQEKGDGISKQSKKKDPKSREYYLVDLPMTKAAMVKSNERIMKGLYQAALVYEEKLKNEEKALESLETLLERFPENPYLLSAYYHAYAINKSLNRTAKSDFYKQKILREFKGSEYAKALSDPNYQSKLDAEYQRAHQLYAQAYEEFQNYYYFKVVSLCNEGLLRYPESDLRPRFLFLRALSVGRTQDVNTFKQSLDQVLKSNPTKEIAQTTKAILAGLEKGAVPVVYTARDMELARQNRLLRNWRIEGDQAMVEVKDKKGKAEKPKSLYQFKADDEHYFVLMFSKKDGDPNRTLFNVSRYNSDAYNSRTFKVDRLSLDKEQIMILVKGLKDKEDALNYFNGIITSGKPYSGLEDVDYRNFVISQANFDQLKKAKDVEQYLDFYTKSYFNVERKPKQSTVKKQGKLVAVNNNLDSTAFVLNQSDNHKFILLVPARKVNIGKLRNDIYNHDKDYSVLREQYDNDLNMIVVNNIGSKTDAMKYFRKLVSDDAIYTQLESVDYRNFVISEENFKKFYVEKTLFPYLDFFKKNYLDAKDVAPAVKEDQMVQDGIYQFNEKVYHYFALVYTKANVNRKQLLTGIKRYNTGELKIQVRELDDEREVLLVTNMRNKKQAMMYFRAIVTNRDLFAPVEKVGYRNFVISDENFEVFVEDGGDTAKYLEFFKKYYLK